MNCPHCNSPDVKLVHGKKQCQSCHREIEESNPETESAPLRAGMIRCPICSHPVSAQAASCPSCGQPLRSTEAADAEVQAAELRNMIRRVGPNIVLAIILFIVYFLFVQPAIDSYLHTR